MSADHEVVWQAHEVTASGLSDGQLIVDPAYKDILFETVGALLKTPLRADGSVREGTWSATSKHNIGDGIMVALKRSNRIDNPPEHIGLGAMRALVSVSHGLRKIKLRDPSLTSCPVQTEDGNMHIVEFEPATPMLVFVPKVPGTPIYARTSMINAFVSGETPSSHELPVASDCQKLMGRAITASGISTGEGIWHDIYSRNGYPRPGNVVVSTRTHGLNGLPLIKMVPIDPYAEDRLNFC